MIEPHFVALMVDRVVGQFLFGHWPDSDVGGVIVDVV
jgi:hypothetical protein